MVEGVKWYRNAAERGHAGASCSLALALRDGHGVAIDLVESFKWQKVAAEGGDAEAQWHLSKAYRSCSQQFTEKSEI